MKSFIIMKCKWCIYTTDKKSNLNRHHTAMHSNEIQALVENKSSSSNDSRNLEIHSKFLENHSKTIGNTLISKSPMHSCAKCGKQYKGIKFLEEHERKCLGVDIMTCPKCMKTFKHQPSKSRHIKDNRCKPRSIFEYKDRQNITINNNITNNNTFNIKNNIFINDYGKERDDYITDAQILKIVKNCNSSIIPKYISLKHFHPSYPENTNIKFDNNVYLIKREGDWDNIDGDILVKELYNKNRHFIGKYCFDNDDKIKGCIQNEDMYERLKEKTDFNTMELKGEDKEIKKNIKSVIKTRYYNKKKAINI